MNTYVSLFYQTHRPNKQRAKSELLHMSSCCRNVEIVSSEEKTNVREEERKYPPNPKFSFHVTYKFKIENVSINSCNRYIENHGNVITVIMVTNTVTGEETVMVSFQNTNITKWAVMRSFRPVLHTFRTVFPTFRNEDVAKMILLFMIETYISCGTYADGTRTGYRGSLDHRGRQTIPSPAGRPSTRRDPRRLAGRPHAVVKEDSCPALSAQIREHEKRLPHPRKAAGAQITHSWHGEPRLALESQERKSEMSGIPKELIIGGRTVFNEGSSATTVLSDRPCRRDPRPLAGRPPAASRPVHPSRPAAASRPVHPASRPSTPLAGRPPVETRAPSRPATASRPTATAHNRHAVVKEGKRHALAGPISRPFHGSQTVGKGDIVAARPYASGYGHRCKQSGYEHDGSRDAGKNQSHGTSVGIIASDTSRKGRPGLNRETAGARKKGCRRPNRGSPRHSRHRYTHTHGKNDIEKTPTRRDKRWEKQ
ncbi:Hypothetical predicted protein [Mytilus galloprovincialis]|uniref:Uncharacterized protein n=1 Tax=Mytilus galloprovincialis TaxID=29158 RepID=A0A8B6EF65_MYTGA|nr:Hypothetical predicted protein [Mytilus galloprovincialis]